MKLFNNESSTLCASKFWVVIKNDEINIPVISIPSQGNALDYDSVNGTYHVYSVRTLNSNTLHWSTNIIIRRSESDKLLQYIESESTHTHDLIVSDFEHDNVDITNQGRVKLIEI